MNTSTLSSFLDQSTPAKEEFSQSKSIPFLNEAERTTPLFDATAAPSTQPQETALSLDPPAAQTASECRDRRQQLAQRLEEEKSLIVQKKSLVNEAQTQHAATISEAQSELAALPI
jgi:hypothetical protein